MARQKLTRREAIEKLKGVSEWMRENVEGFKECQRTVRGRIQKTAIAGGFGRAAQEAAMKQ